MKRLCRFPRSSTGCNTGAARVTLDASTSQSSRPVRTVSETSHPPDLCTKRPGHKSFSETLLLYLNAFEVANNRVHLDNSAPS